MHILFYKFTSNSSKKNLVQFLPVQRTPGGLQYLNPYPKPIFFNTGKIHPKRNLFCQISLFLPGFIASFGRYYIHLNLKIIILYFQALWLSENQAKPMLAFQTDYDEQTGDQVTIILPIFLGILTLKKKLTLILVKLLMK